MDRALKSTVSVCCLIVFGLALGHANAERPSADTRLDVAQIERLKVPPFQVKVQPVLKVSVDKLQFTRQRSGNSSDIRLSMDLWYTVVNNGAEFRINQAPSGNAVGSKNYIVRITGHDVVNKRALFTLEHHLSYVVRSVLRPGGRERSDQLTLTPAQKRIGKIYVPDIPTNIGNLSLTSEILLQGTECHAMAVTQQTFQWSWRKEGNGRYSPNPVGQASSSSSFDYSRKTPCPTFLR